MKTEVRNVEFRLGEIEHLPVADASIDVIMSNCVINRSTDRPAIFREAFRVLAPGGRVALSDIVALRAIPDAVRNDLEAHAGCVSGAAPVPEIEVMRAKAGFRDVHVQLKSNSASLVEGGLQVPRRSSRQRSSVPRNRYLHMSHGDLECQVCR